MSSLEQHATFTPHEMEFFAEDEPITIIPNFSLPAAERSTLSSFAAEHGPFRPNRPLEVPLWMAVALHTRKKCRIEPPEWMDPDNLQRMLEDERSRAEVFQPLPFHYVEVAHVLFTQAKSCFGDQLYQVQDLVETLRKVRFTKVDAGLKILSGPMTVKLNNLSAMECNLIRPFFAGALDRFYMLAKTSAPQDMGSLE